MGLLSQLVLHNQWGCESHHVLSYLLELQQFNKGLYLSIICKLSTRSLSIECGVWSACGRLGSIWFFGTIRSKFLQILVGLGLEFFSFSFSLLTIFCYLVLWVRAWAGHADYLNNLIIYLLVLWVIKYILLVFTFLCDKTRAWLI